jgi:predicted GIY-YIG superfamily endonuclease
MGHITSQRQMKLTFTKCYVYCLVFPNGKQYIGISNDVQRRIADHRRGARRGEGYLVHRAMRKFHFEFQICIFGEANGSKQDMQNEQTYLY